MNGIEQYLVDTNILIYYLNGEALIIELFKRYRHSLFLSVMTRMEVLSYPYNTSEDAIVRAFLDCFQLVFLDEEIMEQTITFRRQRKIKMPDAIIAATTTTRQLTLVTRNTDDFKGLGLSILNPFETVI